MNTGQKHVTNCPNGTSAPLFCVAFLPFVCQGGTTSPPCHHTPPPCHCVRCEPCQELQPSHDPCDHHEELGHEDQLAHRSAMMRWGWSGRGGSKRCGLAPGRGNTSYGDVSAMYSIQYTIYNTTQYSTLYNSYSTCNVYVNFGTYVRTHVHA